MSQSHTNNRVVPVSMSREQFQEIGYQLVDDIAYFLDSIDKRPVASNTTPTFIKDQLGSKELPEEGRESASLMQETSKILFDYSTFNGHPRFWGYITSSATPIGILADMLAATINPNVGGWNLSPVATEIEKQTIQWIAGLIGYDPLCGGILVSGGNMANFVGFVAARQATAKWSLREEGFRSEKSAQMVVYVSAETHTWIQKAADLFGIGTNYIRWIETDGHQRMQTDHLQAAIEEDLATGKQPMMVVGTAGSVSTGAIDPIRAIAGICKEYSIWLHVDGAYGAFAAALPEAHDDMKAISLADSVAMDPHKWLYSPLEAGCALVKNPQHLLDAFSYHPEYYHFGEDEKDPKTNFYEYGFQNSRGFRALKVWMGLKNAGRNGVVQMIRDDIRLASLMADALRKHGEFDVFTNDLSITTFRFNPQQSTDNEYLNTLNSSILTTLQEEGKMFVSNAVIDGKFVLRACIVNFRTTDQDVQAVPGLVAEVGKRLLTT